MAALFVFLNVPTYFHCDYDSLVNKIVTSCLFFFGWGWSFFVTLISDIYLILSLQELSENDRQGKFYEEKLFQAKTALMKIKNALNDEEMKRGNTRILAEDTSDSTHLYAGDLLTQVLSNFLKEDCAKISDMKLRNEEVCLTFKI